MADDSLDDAYDEFGGATPGSGEGDVEDRLSRDAANIACDGNLCQIFEIEMNSKKFTVSANLGDSGLNNKNNGTTYNAYYGGGNNGSGGASGQQSGTGYGIGITWEKTNCHKKVNVDRSVYNSITTYMKLLVNDDGSTNPAFTPAEQTIIVFYTTMMELIKGTTCG